MSQLNFIERNPQKVLEECIAEYERLSGQVLHPATPERILIDILAYRESLLREAIQDACLQNTVDNARGEFLDALGRLLGVVRLDGEDDEAMRLRVRLAPERFAAGTKSAYRFHALSAGAKDALVYGYNEKSDVPIGTVRVAITGQSGEPDEELRAAVLNALNDEKVRCVCDVIEIANDVPGEVTPFDVDFTIGVKVKRGYDENAVCVAVQNKFLTICTVRYTGRFRVVISWAEVSQTLFLEGVEQLELIEPSSPIVTPSFPSVSYFVPTVNVVLL
jgi:phage-related baseplate assembly protein